MSNVKGKILKALGITVLAVVLSLIFVQPFSFSVFSLFSSPIKNDISVSDFYTQVADRSPISRMDSDIVIVNIDRLDRNGIAVILDKVNRAHPRVIGMDVIFEEPRDTSDRRLIMAIKNADNIVLPLALEESGDKSGTFVVNEKSFFTDSLISYANITTGAVNLPSSTDRGTVREYTWRFPDERAGKVYPSFGYELARLYRPEAVSRLESRDADAEYIDYVSKEFMVLEPEEVTENMDVLRDRIVLFGTIADKNDLHPSPLSPAMSGVEIHAYILSTILEGKYYAQLSTFFSWVIGFMLCFFVILTAIVSGMMLKGLVVRILQIVLVIGAVWLGYTLYVEKQIIVDWTSILLMITFGLFAADIWNGVAEIIHRRRSKS